MQLIKTFLFFLPLLCSHFLNAQSGINNLPDESNTSATGTANASDYFEMLEHYHKHPININIADRGTLSELHILSSTQINAIIYHIIKFGPLISIYELQSIACIDVETIKKLIPYINIEEDNSVSKDHFLRLFKGGQHTLILYYERPLESAQGFLNSKDSISGNDYLGKNFKTNIRYRYSNGSKLSMGFNADKDIGEPFFNKYQPKGFDFYSAHLFIQNMGWLKQLAIGDYHISIGQGVGIGSGFVLNKSIEVLQVHRYSTGLRPYRSLNEFGFFRGAAATIGTGKFSIMVYSSAKKSDGNTLMKDTAIFSEERYYNLIQTGYHRTAKELALKNTSVQKVFGAYLQTQLKRLHAGIGYISGQTNNSMKCVHSDFMYTNGNYSFFGEVALQQGKSKAVLLGLMTSLHKNIDMAVIYRNYNASYLNPLSNAFSNASNPSNENGIYTGFNIKLNSAFRFLCYADLFNSPQPHYRTNGASHGYDYASAIEYQPGKSFKLEIRYRIVGSEVNLPAEIQNTIGYLIHERRSTLRLQCDYICNKQLVFRTRVEQTGAQKESSGLQQGNMIFQDIHYNSLKNKFGIDFRYCLFNISGSDARIYAFEDDVPYSFNISQLNKTGSHFYIMISCRLQRNVEIWLRYSNTILPYESQLGSGLDKITGNTKETFKLLLKIHF